MNSPDSFAADSDPFRTTLSIADNASNAIASPTKLVDGSSVIAPVARIASGKPREINAFKSLLPYVPSMLRYPRLIDSR